MSNRRKTSATESAAAGDNKAATPTPPARISSREQIAAAVALNNDWHATRLQASQPKDKPQPDNSSNEQTDGGGTSDADS